MLHLTLNEFLAAPTEVIGGQVPSESDWLYLSDYKIYGNFLQLIQKRVLGDLRSGVIVEISPGLHVVEARVMTYAEGRHISRIRVRPQNMECTLGHKIDEIHSGDGGLVFSDVDALSRALDADQRGFRGWHKDLLNEAYEEAAVAYWTNGNMEFPFFEGGFGEDYYPVYALVSDGKTAGMEIEYIGPGTLYPTRSKW